MPNCVRISMNRSISFATSTNSSSHGTNSFGRPDHNSKRGRVAGRDKAPEQLRVRDVGARGRRGREQSQE